MQAENEPDPVNCYRDVIDGFKIRLTIPADCRRSGKVDLSAITHILQCLNIYGHDSYWGMDG